MVESRAETGVAVTEAPPPTEGEPMSLVRYALERDDVDVEVIERLVALQERVTDRNARAAFFDAVSAFQAECPEIPKTRKAKIVSKKTGTTFTYRYAPFEAITRTIRGPLQKHGLAYSFDADLDGDVLWVTCVLRHIEGHEERSRFPVPIDTNSKMSDAQANGAALTTGRRQSLTAVLGLTETEDTDAAPNPEDMEPIDPNQIEKLEVMLEEAGADEEKFLDYMEVERISQITKGDYDKAHKALTLKKNARSS